MKVFAYKRYTFEKIELRTGSHVSNRRDNLQVEVEVEEDAAV
jgi:hypothetical protein